MNKFQSWAEKRKPKVEVRPRAEEKIYQSTPEEDFKQAWEDWKYEVRVPLRILKAALGLFSIVLLLLAGAVVSIQTDCYLDKNCRESIQKVNR